MKKYQVIGGQYEQSWKGESDTLLGAKRIASRNEEYWDNWQGWHTPAIYAAEDCSVIKCRGWITMYDGSETIVSNDFAEPVAWKDRSTGKWVNGDR